MRKSYRFNIKVCTLLGLVAVMGILTFCKRQGQRQRAGEIVVIGGPQLESAFEDIANAFEKQNESVRVVCKFTCPPCILRTSSRPMPRGDLLVAMGKKDIESFEQKGLIDLSKRVEFANAELVLVSKSGRSSSIKSIKDLANPNVKKIVIGDPNNVSPGYYAKQSLEKLKLWQKIQGKIVYDSSGCLVLRRVSLGEADAGIVFNCCVKDYSNRPGRVDVIQLVPKETYEKITFEIVPFKQSRNASVAQRFVAFVKSEEGQKILASHGVSTITK